MVTSTPTNANQVGVLLFSVKFLKLYKNFYDFQEMLANGTNKRRSENGGLMMINDKSSIPWGGYPGDISPPSHRPQSVMAGGGHPSPLSLDAQLPPNTATLSRGVSF